MSYAVEVFRATDLVTGGGREPEDFEAVWRRMPIAEGAWRGNGSLQVGGERLFVKANRLGLGIKPKRWGRRWDIEREVEAWRRLRDSGLPLVRPVAWGVERVLGLPVRTFLVMEWIDGGVDFEQWLRARAGESDAEARAARHAVGTGVGDVIAALHQRGWVHGDLAARNLLVREEGEEPRFLLLDLARVRRTDGRGRLALLDLYRLAKTAMKAGMSQDEVVWALEPAAGERAREIALRTRQIRAIRWRFPRKLRHWAWLRLGL
jgi:tRNA A-37 threonylcarbamoyl transferase component Bud32